MEKASGRIVAARGGREGLPVRCNPDGSAREKGRGRPSAKRRESKDAEEERRPGNEGGTEREAQRGTDRRPSISIALRLSLWPGLSVSFSRNGHIVSSLRSYGRGLKYSCFLPAARIHRMPKATATSRPSSATFAGIQSFPVHSMLVAHSVSFCRCL